MNKAARLKQDGVTDDPILFYRGDDPDYGFMSSFSRLSIIVPHPVLRRLQPVGPWLPGHPPATYETREHYYQACKATNLKDHEWVRTATGPSEAKQRGRVIKLRDDWGNDRGDICWYVMVESIFAVCFQHIEVGEALVATENRAIYEDSPVDDIWGWRYGNDYSGKNLLGQAWMHVRSVFNPLEE